MENQIYCSEIESLLIQFQSALDDAKIYRRRQNTDQVELVIPRYIISGKQRVFMDIVNQAKNITLPVCVIAPKSIKIDTDRNQNKWLEQPIQFADKFAKHKQPTPISLSVNVTFFSTFWADIWQMFANFAAYTNNYFYISWQVPGDFGESVEIRSKVTWDGTQTINFPETLPNEKQFIIEASTGFTIQGFIFNKPASREKEIIEISTNLYNSTQASFMNENGYVENYVKTGWPVLTDILFKNISLINLAKSLEDDDFLTLENGANLVLQGKSFFKEQCAGVLLRPIYPTIEIDSPDLVKFKVNTIKHSIVEGYSFAEDIEIVNENIIKLKLPSLQKYLVYDLVIYNNAGFTSFYGITGHFLKVN